MTWKNKDSKPFFEDLATGDAHSITGEHESAVATAYNKVAEERAAGSDEQKAYLEKNMPILGVTQWKKLKADGKPVPYITYRDETGKLRTVPYLFSDDVAPQKQDEVVKEKEEVVKTDTVEESLVAHEKTEENDDGLVHNGEDSYNSVADITQSTYLYLYPTPYSTRKSSPYKNTLTEGMDVKVLERKGEFYKVTFKRNSKRAHPVYEWVYKDHLKFKEGMAPLEETDYSVDVGEFDRTDEQTTIENLYGSDSTYSALRSIKGNHGSDGRGRRGKDGLTPRQKRQNAFNKASASENNDTVGEYSNKITKMETLFQEKTTEIYKSLMNGSKHQLVDQGQGYWLNRKGRVETLLKDLTEYRKLIREYYGVGRTADARGRKLKVKQEKKNELGAQRQAELESLMKEHPALAALITDPDALKELYNADTPEKLSNLLRKTIEEHYKNVLEVEEELEDDPELIWGNDTIIQLTKAALEINDEDEVFTSIIQRKQEEVKANKQFWKTFNTVVSVGLGLAGAFFTGGASLILSLAGAGVGLVQGIRDFNEAEVDAAMVWNSYKIWDEFC